MFTFKEKKDVKSNVLILVIVRLFTFTVWYDHYQQIHKDQNYLIHTEIPKLLLFVFCFVLFWGERVLSVCVCVCLFNKNM